MGTVLNWSNYLISTFTTGVRSFAQLEFCLSSVHRLLKYTHLEQEQDHNASIGSEIMPDPVRVGEVQFKNVSMRYNSKGPKVLKGINFTCKPGDKVNKAIP